MSNQIKQEEKKRGVSSLVAAVTVAVIGAGIAAAGALVLKDKNNRNKAKKALTNVKDKTVEYVNGLQNQAQDKVREAEKKLAEAKENVKKQSVKG